jgi:hypothetical protein
VQVPGIARLVLELLVFCSAAYALSTLGRPTLSIVFLSIVVFHYVWAYERVAWLIKQ